MIFFKGRNFEKCHVSPGDTAARRHESAPATSRSTTVRICLAKFYPKNSRRSTPVASVFLARNTPKITTKIPARKRAVGPPAAVADRLQDGGSCTAYTRFKNVPGHNKKLG